MIYRQFFSLSLSLSLNSLPPTLELLLLYFPSFLNQSMGMMNELGRHS